MTPQQYFVIMKTRKLQDKDRLAIVEIKKTDKIVVYLRNLVVISVSFCGLYTKKYGLIFKGSAASAPTHSPRHLHTRPSASLMFRARDFSFCIAERI